MIRYDLADKDGNIHELNGSTGNQLASGSLTFPDEKFKLEQKIKDKSAGPGAIALGESRLKSKRLKLNYFRAEPLDSDYMTQENELIAFLTKATCLIDQTNMRKTKIRILEHSLKYEDGNHKVMGEGSINVQLLEPFWEDVNAQEASGAISGGDQDSIDFTVGGYYEVQPIITMIASGLCNSLDIFLNTDNPLDRVGLNINDPSFGTVGYETMVIDCVEGTVKIGDLDRTQFIEEGTGFFVIPVGTTPLVFNPSGDIAVTIEYRRRYFV